MTYILWTLATSTIGDMILAAIWVISMDTLRRPESDETAVSGVAPDPDAADDLVSKEA